MQCSLHLLPFWHQLLPPPTSSTTLSLLLFRIPPFHSWRSLRGSGQLVIVFRPARCRQKVWATIKAKILADALLDGARDSRESARLLASRARESGVWLNVLPISSLGLCMDDSTIRVTVGPRLGAPLCRPHTCRQCSAEVDSVATHGLSCRWSEGRHHHHMAVNDIIHRALSSAKIPSCLEPSGLDRKRPDGALEEWQVASAGCHVPRHFCLLV